ncbi:MAG: MBL fold metallo-hydrolase [Actinobacteria bacterium]|nr:MBL fold metallo-hydrolase [Actinomycetota bacterium]
MASTTGTGGAGAAGGGGTRLDELTTVVRAPNPSPQTLDGTNTYLVGVPGAGAVVIVDPGPALAEHRRAVEEAVAGRDAEVAAVVVTHHHDDHAQAAGWAAAWSARLLAWAPRMVGHPGAAPLADARWLAIAGVRLQVLHTPGHSPDHVCLLVGGTGVVLTGDHILGRGTTTVGWPDGDMGSYLASLRRVGRSGATALYPGHGPVVADARGRVGDYLAHRRQRARQVLAALAGGARTPDEVVERVYAGVDPALRSAARRNVRAQLELLARQGRAARLEGGPPPRFGPR